MHFMGRTQQMDRELARASVYALSSRFEGFPMVLIEAMGVGLPVVAFDCPRGPGDLVVNGENGLLIPDQDVDALAAGLRRVIEDDALRSTMATAARRTATDYCLDGPLGRMWRRLLSELAASGPSS